MLTIAQTPRTIIREFLPEDLEIYLDHYTDERIMHHMPRRDREERITIFNKALQNYLITKTTGIWGIFHKTNGDHVGTCLLRYFNDEPGVVEIGYSLAYDYWGQGLATEMADALVAHALADATTLEVVAVTTLDNAASQRVLEKAGLKRLGNLMRDELELAFFKLKA